MKQKQESNITLVGLPSGFESGLEQLQNYLKDNALTTEKIPLPYQVAEFFSTFSSEIGADEELSKVDWYQETGGIHVKGRAQLVCKGCFNSKSYKAK